MNRSGNGMERAPNRAALRLRLRLPVFAALIIAAVLASGGCSLTPASSATDEGGAAHRAETSADPGTAGGERAKPDPGAGPETGSAPGGLEGAGNGPNLDDVGTIGGTEDSPGSGAASGTEPGPATETNGRTDTTAGAGAPDARPPSQPPKTVVYTGPVEHIFFHPLIIYPELAFDGDEKAQGYDDWFVTVPEFKAILESLYEQGFMLVDLQSLFERKNDGGRQTIARRELRMPEGKKPLVLSIDDMNYYDYMRRNGNVFKLIVGSDGRIAAYSKDPSGADSVSTDNEIVPIVDAFVERHPDFSLNGAKGLIALTGYEGVLGYRTNDSDPATAESERREAGVVVERLKADGWTFASHGWGHLDAGKVTLERLIADTKRWKDEVEPIVGPTPVYVYPYGSRPETGSAKFRALEAAGFDILCSVGPTPYLKVMPDAAMMDRRHIDGIALRTQRDKLLGLFDADKVIDPVRPKTR